MEGLETEEPQNASRPIGPTTTTDGTKGRDHLQRQFFATFVAFCSNLFAFFCVPSGRSARPVTPVTPYPKGRDAG